MLTYVKFEPRETLLSLAILQVLPVANDKRVSSMHSNSGSQNEISLPHPIKQDGESS